MKKKKSPKRPKFSGDEHHRVWNATRDVIDEEFTDKDAESKDVARRVMKRLCLPMSNITAVYMMEYCAIQIAGDVLRHYFDSDSNKPDPAQGNFGEEYSPRIQDRYGIVRDGTRIHVLRKNLTLTEMQGIIKKLKMIGAAYYDHADALQKEMESRFPDAAAS